MSGKKRILVLVCVLVSGWWLLTGLAVVPEEQPKPGEESVVTAQPAEVEGFVFSSEDDPYAWSSTESSASGGFLELPAADYSWDRSL